MRALLLWALAAAAPSAQVVLGGWALPEGAVVESTTMVELDQVVSEGDRAVPFESLARDRSRTVIDRVEGGRLSRATQRVETSTSKTLVEGRSAPDAPDVLLGRPVVVERTASGWRQRADGWAPTPEQQDALDDETSLDDAEYPSRPVAVGETVVVPDSALRAVYHGATPGPHRLTVRLDSVGTWGGGPAAFVTQEVSVAVADGDGTLRMDMTARIVRRLDWLLDVRTVWEGRTTFDDGEATTAGFMRYTATQTVTLPGAPDR